MRWFVGAVVVGALGCCMGGEEAPAPAPPPTPAAAPLSQVFGEMGLAGDPNANINPTVPPAPAAPGSEPAPAAAAPPAPEPAACASARAAREQVRADLAGLRLSLGADTSTRLDAAERALLACHADPACMGDGPARLARLDAYNAAKAANEGESRRLAEAEVGLFHADRAVAAACGTP